MTQQHLILLLNDVGIEQLVGIAIGSTLLCVSWLIVMRIVRRRSASVQSVVWQATCSSIVMTTVVLFTVLGIPLATQETVESRPLTTVSLQSASVLSCKFIANGLAHFAVFRMVSCFLQTRIV